MRANSHVITKFPRMGILLHFLTHGAPLRALRVRELRYKRKHDICFVRPLKAGLNITKEKFLQLA